MDKHNYEKINLIKALDEQGYAVVEIKNGVHDEVSKRIDYPGLKTKPGWKRSIIASR